jgi:hypothetical protein
MVSQATNTVDAQFRLGNPKLLAFRVGAMPGIARFEFKRTQ